MFDLPEQSILSLLDQREEVYNAITSDIFERISLKLNTAVTALLPTSSVVEWTSVEKVNGHCIRVMGISAPPIGRVVNIAEQAVTITAENSSNYKQIVRFIFPLALLEGGSDAKILDFMQDINAISTILTEQDLVQLLTAYDFSEHQALHDTVEYAKLLDKVTKPSEVLGFSTDNLTDDHIRQLYLSAGTMSETKN